MNSIDFNLFATVIDYTGYVIDFEIMWRLLCLQESKI